MADRKITELTNITGTNIADADEFVVVDASADETKAITAAELRTAIGNGDFTVTGDLTVQGTTITVDSASAQNIVLGDNDKMTFGAGSDLQIFHDGSNSYLVDNGTGDLYLRASSNMYLQSAGGTKYLDATASGDVNLYYSNALKLSTTSTGIDVTGTLTANDLTLEDSTPVIFMKDTDGASQWLSITHENGNTNYTTRNGSDYGHHYFKAYNGASTANRFHINADGDSNFFNTSGAVKLKWDATNERLGIGVASPDSQLHVYGAGQTTANLSDSGNQGGFIRVSDASNSAGAGGGVIFASTQSDDTGAVGMAAIKGLLANGSGNTIGDLAFSTRANTTDTALTERMRLTYDGNLGIGTQSPNQKLTVSGGNIGVDGFVTTPEIRTYNGQQLVLSAGESYGYATGQTGENVYLNSEYGVEVNTSPDNWASGWAGRKTALIRGDLARFNGDIVSDSGTGSSYIFVGPRSTPDTGLPTGNASTDTGVNLWSIGIVDAAAYSNNPMRLNRMGTDGNIAVFFAQGNAEGIISVSGTTVSYNGGHLARWSRLIDDNMDTTIVKGTVMTNLDEMVVWHHEAQPATYYEEGDELPVVTEATYYEEGDDIPEGKSLGDVKTEAVYAQIGDEKTPAKEAYTEENEQLNKMAVSSVEGDPNVAGVFVNWDNDDDEFNDMNIAMTGDMVIRIAQGTTVARGDLLMSAGDGTAKPQGDDIVRSKTIAKVTSTNVSHTYDDGSYLVPCVLMAC